MACVVGTVVGLLVRIWIVPHLHAKILEIKSNLTHTAIQMTQQHLDHHLHHHQQKNSKENPVDIMKLTPIVNNDENGGIDNSCPPSANNNNNQNQNQNDDHDNNNIRKSIDVEIAEKNNVQQSFDVDDDKPEVAKIFTFLHILTACFSSFAHGANDTR